MTFGCVCVLLIQLMGIFRCGCFRSAAAESVLGLNLTNQRARVVVERVNLVLCLISVVIKGSANKDAESHALAHVRYRLSKTASVTRRYGRVAATGVAKAFQPQGEDFAHPLAQSSPLLPSGPAPATYRACATKKHATLPHH